MEWEGGDREKKQIKKTLYDKCDVPELVLVTTKSRLTFDAVLFLVKHC